MVHQSVPQFIRLSPPTPLHCIPLTPLAGRIAVDLEAFAKHAKRRTVTVDDVLLTVRRSDALVRGVRQCDPPLLLTRANLRVAFQTRSLEEYCAANFAAAKPRKTRSKKTAAAAAAADDDEIDDDRSADGAGRRLADDDDDFE